MAFNVGTALVVLSSVRRRSVWNFLAAVALYTVSVIAPRLVVFEFSDLQIFRIAEVWTFALLAELARLLVALLPFWLIFHLRKTVNTPAPQTRG